MKKSILVIDDEAHIRQLYKQFFSLIGLSGFEVIESSNAAQAIDQLIHRKIDLIILDINLQYLDGPIIFNVIKEYDPNLKIIVASVLPIEQQKRMIPYASEYFDKSQGLFKLFEKVSSNLN